MAIWVYARVSTKEQYANGVSLEQQVEICRSRFSEIDDVPGKATNCDEPGVFVDSISAWKYPLRDRAGGMALLRVVQPGDTIVLYAIHRGWRNVRHFAEEVDLWVRLGVNIRFASYPGLDITTANGRFVAAVWAAYSQWNSDIKSERVREAAALRKAGLLKKTRTQTKIEQATPFESASQEKVTKGVLGRRRVTPYSEALSQILRERRASQCEKPVYSDRRVFGYVRVSTVLQTVDQQVGPVQSYMDHLKLRYEGIQDMGIVRDEGVSAYKVDFRKRPNAGRLYDELRAGDVVVFLRPARAFRSLRDMGITVEALLERGVEVHIAESGANSTGLDFAMQMRLMVMIAEMESEEIGRRKRMSTEFMLKNGVIPRGCQPKWITEKEHRDGTRSLFVNFEYVRLMRLCTRLHQRGITPRAAAKAIERMLAHEECRPEVPQYGVTVAAYKKMLARHIKGRDTIWDKRRRQKFLKRLMGMKASKEIFAFSHIAVRRCLKSWKTYSQWRRIVADGATPQQAVVAAVGRSA